jgi:hypothetical protein
VIARRSATGDVRLIRAADGRLISSVKTQGGLVWSPSRDLVADAGGFGPRLLRVVDGAALLL